MSNNVRCAGGGQIAKDPAPFGLGPTHYKRPTNGEPCGWKGERFALGLFTEGEVEGLRVYSDEWLDAAARADERARTTKPCPRCGGRVELIPAEVEP